MRKQNAKIFIVEDDKFYAQLIQAFLTNLGYTDTKCFHSGSSCIENIQENPQIVILDYTLGLENGLEILKQIKNYNESIQVVMLSGQEYLHVSVKAFKHGASDYIEKNKDSLKNLESILNKIAKHPGNSSRIQAFLNLFF